MQLELAKRIVALYNETKNWDALAELYRGTHGAMPSRRVLSEWFEHAQQVVDHDDLATAEERALRC